MSEAPKAEPKQVDRALQIFHVMNRSGEGLFSEALRRMDGDRGVLTPQDRVIGHISLLIEALGDARLSARVGARQMWGDQIVNDVHKIVESAKATIKEDFKPLLEDLKLISGSLTSNKTAD